GERAGEGATGREKRSAAERGRPQWSCHGLLQRKDWSKGLLGCRGVASEVRKRDGCAAGGDRLRGERRDAAPGDRVVDVDGGSAALPDSADEFVDHEEVAPAVSGLAGLGQVLFPEGVLEFIGMGP